MPKSIEIGWQLYCHIERYEVSTLAVDGWAVTFGTARTRLGGAAARPGLSSLYSPPISAQCTNHRIDDPLFCGFNVAIKGKNYYEFVKYHVHTALRVNLSVFQINLFFFIFLSNLIACRAVFKAGDYGFNPTPDVMTKKIWSVLQSVFWQLIDWKSSQNGCCQVLDSML